eukprot:TRINITY_DN5857_c2_g1_i1.p1 TRINITY_DN5857_c2_g1~~TRINITY_DN5857_c2_g1_i1.p1  ORF type:complete len:168 (-),score=39.98 TRINITY_DN5857_c2_g1_i1:281-748(-)
MAGTLSFQSHSCESQESRYDRASANSCSNAGCFSALHFLLIALLLQLLAAAITEEKLSCSATLSHHAALNDDVPAKATFNQTMIGDQNVIRLEPEELPDRFAPTELCIKHNASAFAEIARVLATASLAAAWCKSTSGREFDRSLRLANNLLHQVM